MLVTLRRLAGISLCALLAACPTSVGAPTAAFTANPASDATVGQIVQLDGSGSTDPGSRELTYAWSFAKLPEGSAATFNDVRSVTPSFTADVPGTFAVQLIVANAYLSSPAITHDLVVAACGSNRPTTGALAVNPSSPGVGVVTQVSAPEASDADNAAGCALGQTLSYTWKLVSQPPGSTVALNNVSAIAPSFVPDLGGDYIVRLTLTDSTGRSSLPAEKTITALACGSNAPAVTSITPSVGLPGLAQAVQLTPTVRDDDNAAACGSLGQTFSYQWTIQTLPQGSRAALNSAVSETPSFTTDLAGAYSFRLVVTDSTGRSSAPFDVSLTASACGGNQPVATVSFLPAAPQLGTAVQLSTTVTDVDNDTCNLDQTFTYAWSLRAQPSGSAAALNNPTGLNPTFTADVAGSYLVQLIVKDSAGVSSAPVQETITVTGCGNAAPVIAPLTQTSPAAAPNPGDSVTIGSTVTDADDACKLVSAPDQKQTYTWTMKSRPQGSSAFVLDPTATSATFATDLAGTYQLQLSVTDETGRSAQPRFIDVTTTACGLHAPAITAAGMTFAGTGKPNAGAEVTLSATWSDADNIASCGPNQSVVLTWNRLQGPPTSAAVLTKPVSDPATAPGAVQDVTFTPDKIGTYQFQVIATDVKGMTSAPAFVTFETSVCGSAVPTVTATPALSTNLTPLVSVQLAASPADVDNNGTCLANQLPFIYRWSILTRPPLSKSVVSDPSIANPTFTPDVSGDYQLEVTVTDTTGLTSAPALVRLTASSCGEVGPTLDPTTPITVKVGGTLVDSGIKMGSTADLATSTITANNCVATGTSYTYDWRLESRPAGSQAAISLPSAAGPSFLADKAGSYLVSVVVTNALGYSSDKQFKTIIAAPCGLLPIAWGSTPITTSKLDPEGAAVDLHVGAQVTLGTHITNPNETDCGPGIAVTPYSYRWALLAAPAGSLASLSASDTAAPSFVPDVQGIYQVSAKVIDALGNETDTSTLPITTSRCGANAPTATVSGAGSINANTETSYAVTFDNADNHTGLAQGLCQPRFAVPSHSFAWSISTQPINGHATLASQTGTPTTVPPGATNLFSASVQGSYGLSATATASTTGLSSLPFELPISVLNCGSNAPTISSVTTKVGGTPTSRPPLNTPTTLTAIPSASSCTLEDVASYTWTIVSLPSGSGLTVPAPDQLTPDAVVAFDVAGTFALAVTAKNGAGLVSAPLIVTIETAACAPGSLAADGGNTFGIVATTAAPFKLGVSVALNLAAPLTDSCVASPTYSYSWTFTGKPPASTATLDTANATPDSSSFTPDVVGRYVAQLIVTDNAGFVSPPVSATIDVESCGTAAPTLATLTTVPSLPNTGDLVTLSTVVTDTTNSTACAPVSVLPIAYNWTLVSRPQGSTAHLTSTTAAAPSIAVDRPGIYLFSLSAVDALGNASATSFYPMTVSACGSSTPVITQVTAPSARPDLGSITLTAKTFDADTALLTDLPPGVCAERTSPTVAPLAIDTQFLWTLVSAPAGSAATGLTGYRPSTASPTNLANDDFTFTADVTGTYSFRVTAKDGQGHVSEPSTVTVTTSVCGPKFLSALSYGSAAVGTLFTPTGAAVDTTSACITGTAVVTKTFSFLQRPFGSSATIAADTGTFTPEMAGVYVIQMVAADQAGNTSVVTASATASPCAPAPSAPTISATLLAPNLSTDADEYVGTRANLSAAITPAVCGNLSSTSYQYSWSLVAKPAGSTSALSSGSLATPSFVFDKPGAHYEVALSVTDNLGNVFPPAFKAFETSLCGFQGPTTAIAGALSINTYASTTLTATVETNPGSLSCPPLRFVDGTPTVAWRLISGPVGGQLTFNSTTGTNVTVSPDKPSGGTAYTIGVRATSNAGVTGPEQTFSLTANACGGHAPTAMATPIASPTTPAFTATQVIGTAPYTSTSAPPSGGTAGAILKSGHPIQISVNLVDLDSFPVVDGGCGLTNQAFNVHWTLSSAPAGSIATLSNADTLTPSFTPDVSGDPTPYVLTLVATDETNLSSTQQFSIKTSTCGINAPSITDPITSTPSSGFAIGTPIALHATVLDADLTCGLADPSTLSWRFVALPAGSTAALSGANTDSAGFIPDLGSTDPYIIEAKATDSTGRTATRTISITVPVADPLVIGTLALTQTVPQLIGGPKTITTGLFYQHSAIKLSAPVTAGAQACLTATGGDFPCTYAWSFLSVPAGSSTVAFNSATLAEPSFTPDVGGVDPGLEYIPVLTVSNGSRSTTKVFPAIHVGVCGGQAPTPRITLQSPALAVPPFNVLVNAVVQVTGTTSSDADADPSGTGSGCNLPQTLSYTWALTAMPSLSTAGLSSTSLLNPTFTADKVGTYTVRLTASDGLLSASTSIDIIAVTGEIGRVAANSSIFHATVIEPGTNKPIVAFYDPNTNGGEVYVKRCSGNCAVPFTSTWDDLGVVEQNIGTMTWTAGNEPRPLAVTLDQAGRINLAYWAGNAGSCLVKVASSSGNGIWDQKVIASTTSCFPNGGGGNESMRWISADTGTDNSLLVAYNFFDGTGPTLRADFCTNCALGTPATSMTFSLTQSSTWPGNSLNSVEGRFVSVRAMPGANLALAWQSDATLRHVRTCRTEFATGGYGGQCSVVEVPLDGGDYAALATSGSSSHITAYDPVAGRVAYATCTPSGATTCANTGDFAVTSLGHNGPFGSIAASASNVFVSFYDVSSDSLMVATGNTTTPPAFTFLSRPGAVLSTSTATGGNGPRVVYSTPNGATTDVMMFKP